MWSSRLRPPDDAFVLLGVVAGRHVEPELDAPRSGSSWPARILSRVVLPAPLRPMISRRSPRPTSKLTSENTSSVAVALPELGGGEDGAPGGRRGREAQVELPAWPRARRPCRGVMRGDAVVEALGDACPLGGLAAHLVGEGREALDLRGLLGGDLDQALLVPGPGGEVLGVGALVLDDLADGLLGLAVEVDDPGDGLVEQIEVVADDEQGAAVGAQELEQPVAGVGVEVVRRLVEQQQVAAREEDAGQLEPAPLAAGEGAEGQSRRSGRRPRPSTRRCTSDSAA